MSLALPASGRRARRIAASLALLVALVAAPVVAQATTAPIPAAAAASTLSLSATQLEAGSTLTVTYSTDDPHPTNWIGLYSAGQTPGSVASTKWDYTPDASGTLEFVLDLPAGSYAIWFLARDGYTPLAEPLSLTVTAPAGTPVPGDPNAPVEIDPVPADVATDGVIAREGFDAGLPEGWIAEGGWAATTRAEWTATVDEMRGRFARPLAGFLAADAGQAGALDTTLTSAPVPVAGLASVRLTFDSHYRGAAGQTGVVTVSFDGEEPVEVLRLDSQSVTDGYDGMQLNARQDVTVEVPRGAATAVVSWEYDAPAGAARYWAIDSFAVHQVAVASSAPSTNAWVVSDIQGHPADFAHGLRDLAELAPDPAGLLMVGDIVNSGTVGEWDEIYAVMDGSEDIRPDVTVAAIGNHERYAAGGFAANRDRFLAFAERDRVWDEYVLTGAGGDLPVIVLGQEFAAPSDVAMSDAQVEFLEERLAHWTALDKQVLVITHFPLGDTVSASWIPGYHTHHQHNARLTGILGNYPNAIVFTGHTHYPAELGDWAVQRRTADGTADGFWAVNTLAMHVEWDARGENTRGVSEVVTRDVNRGLVVESFGDRVVVTARDFASDEQLRQVTIRNPLVPFTPALAPIVPADYTGVDAAVADVPSDLDRYTAESVARLRAALSAVERGLPADRQDEVDAMAAALRAAIDGLEFIGSSGGGGGTGGDAGGALANTGAEVTGIVSLAVALLLGGGAVTALRLRRVARS